MGVLRPRNIAETGRVVSQTKHVVDGLRKDVAELRRTADADRQRGKDQHIALERQLEQMNARMERMLQEIDGLGGQLTALSRATAEVRLRESQLRAIAERNIALEHYAVQPLLDDPSFVEYVRSRIGAATLHLEPLPYVVVDRLLPDPLYDALLTGIPPSELFSDRPLNKRQMNVPFHLAPAYSRAVWGHMARQVIPRAIMPAVVDKFREPLLDWLGATLGTTDPKVLEGMVSSDGRILLRGPGYYIRPHRDPKWGFLTTLLYLARPTDDESMGTQLFSVDEDPEAIGAAPHWIGEHRCRLEATIEFKPNRALIFLNSKGAHGAEIPDDAPEGLERYIYQFRIGPGSEQIRSLIAALPPERRAAWDGKISDY